MIEDLMKALTLALADYDASYAVSGPNQAYPRTVFSFVGPSAANAVAQSFTADTETWAVQVSVYDDDDDCVALLQTLAGAEAAVQGMAGTGICRVRRVGGTGPVFLNSEREWRATVDFAVTMAREI